MTAKPDKFTQDYLTDTERDLDRISVMMFLCGSGQPTNAPRRRSRKPEDIRSFLRKRIRSELTQCDVRLGEHKDLISAFKRAAGRAAANLADHELGLARKKNMDLVVIFPCSPGSFAELGMFSMAKTIASKMVVFVDRRHRKENSYLKHGPISAARLRSARVFYVDYSDRDHIWTKVKNLVRQQKTIKRGAKLFAK